MCAVATPAHPPTRDGERTAARIRERLQSRERRALRRSAHDLHQLDEIETRQKLRRAEQMRRCWFVIGRLLSNAAQDDERWRSVLDHLLRSSELAPREAKLLGLTKRA